MPFISNPPATWKHGVNEEERKSTWKFAAGPNKTERQHTDARRAFKHKAKSFIIKSNEEAALSKKGVGLNAEDIAVLENKKHMRSKGKAHLDAWRSNPQNRAKQNADANVRDKVRSDALQTERAADFKANGAGLTTEFGLGGASREDGINERVHDIMHSSAGIFQFMGNFEGEATCDNWVRDHGEYTSVKDVLATGEFAAYFLTTKQKIKSGQEIKCPETTAFMSICLRDPLWRIETHTTKPQLFGRPGIGPRLVKANKERDLRLFTREEARTVVRSYILAKCVSAYDATGLEGCLQRYIEKMGLPHGRCLHMEAGAGSRSEFG